MASPTLVMDPSDMARRVVESNLRVVWRGSQGVNLVYVCMYVKSGGIVGGGGTNKHNSIYLFSVCIIIVKIGLITLNGLILTYLCTVDCLLPLFSHTRSDASLDIPCKTILQKIIKHFSS